MKKILLCFIFLSGSIWAKELPVECNKLYTLLLGSTELRKHFPVGENEKKIFSDKWEMMDEKGRQYVEIECMEIIDIIRKSYPELVPKDMIEEKKERPANFPQSCLKVITLSQQAKSLLGNYARDLSNENLANLERNMYQIWAAIDDAGQKKMIEACQNTQRKLTVIIQKAKEETQK